MKLYVATDKAGNVLAWGGTQAEARQAKKETNAHSWGEQEVPTNKADLLAFMKLNCTGKIIQEP